MLIIDYNGLPLFLGSSIGSRSQYIYHFYNLAVCTFVEMSTLKKELILMRPLEKGVAKMEFSEHIV